MDKYYIWTIGCQMNKAESERLGAALERLGLRPVLALDEADVIVLNSCVVRQSAENRVTSMLGMVRSLKERHPTRLVALTGCMVPPRHEGLRRRFPHVDLFSRPGDYTPIAQEVRGRLAQERQSSTDGALPLRPSVSAYVPVTQGCDLMCAYCVIPYRRGRQVSRPLDEIVEEVKVLVQRGAKEVVLLGQTVDAYGYDLPQKPDLADLLRAVNEVPGLERIRFLTSHPRFMTERVLRAIAELNKVCEHINLPLQAGNDEVLQRMGRGYTSDAYRNLVHQIRASIPGVALSTDVIVGFPGETEKEFLDTVRLLEELRFDKVHIAAYSPRPGTISWRRMSDDVPHEEKERRRRVVEELQERIAADTNRGLLGRWVEVLFEGKRKGRWQGRTRSDKLVFVNDARDLKGQLAEVRIERASPWSLRGTLNEVVQYAH